MSGAGDINSIDAPVLAVWHFVHVHVGSTIEHVVRIGSTNSDMP